MIETVWRDFSIRDLALALEDATVDRAWLLDRMRIVGYSDVDADRVTDALMQRSTRAVRERVRASAVGAYAQGSLSREEFDQILEGLELPPARIAWDTNHGALPCKETSAAVLPWNICLTNSSLPLSFLYPMQSPTIPLPKDAASFGAKSRTW